MFKPKNKVAIWRMLYEHVEDKPVDTLFNFKELSEVIDANIRDYRSCLYRVSKELLLRRKMMLVSERGEGYRLVEGMNTFSHAETRHKKATKQIKLADFETANINTVSLSEEEKQTLQQFRIHNRRIAQAIDQQIDAVGMQAVLTAKEIVRLKRLVQGE